MRFISLVAKNVTRRPLRSALTVAAVAIAIGAAVSLVGVAVGFERSFIQLYDEVGVDLVVVRAGVRSVTTSALDQSLAPRLAAVPGVKYVIPSLRENIEIEGKGRAIPNVLAYGWVPGSVVFDHLDVVSGETLKQTHHVGIMLGAGLAANLDMKIGDKVMIFATDEFEVVGIFKSSSVFENGAVIVALPDLQELLDTKGNVTSFDLMLDKPGDQTLVERVRHEVEKIAPGVTITPTREHVDKLSEIRVARAMAWITSAIALVIGTVGTLNTMFMSVHERTREIGILRAIGWRKSRVMRMVLLESVLLSTIGGLAGVGLAFLMLQLLTRLPAASGFIVRYIEPTVVVEGLAIAVLVGLLGGILPARSAARMQPVKAIHYQ